MFILQKNRRQQKQRNTQKKEGQKNKEMLRMMVSPAFCSSFIATNILSSCTHFHSRHTNCLSRYNLQLLRLRCRRHCSSSECHFIDSLRWVYTYICNCAYNNYFTFEICVLLKQVSFYMSQQSRSVIVSSNVISAHMTIFPFAGCMEKL